MKEYYYIGDCVGNPFNSVEELRDVIENAKQVSKKRFLENVNIEVSGEDAIKAMKEYPADFSFYYNKDKDIYFFTDSGIEFFYKKEVSMREYSGRYKMRYRGNPSEKINQLIQEETLDKCGVYSTRARIGDDTLKMYVWDAMFCDYSCGMTCVLARSKEEAIETVKSAWEGQNNEDDIRIIESREPYILARNSVVWTSGGG